MNKAILVFASLLLVAGGVAAIALAFRMQRESLPPSHGGDDIVFVPRNSGDFLKSYELTERSGAKFDSMSLDGKVHVVNFFFATCPARCPMQTQHIAQLQALLQRKGIKEDQAMLLSITVDPAQDTPAVLREYADKYKADSKQWLFLTGEAEYLARVAGEIYQVAYKKQTHIERVLLVDKWGQVRGVYRWYDPTDFAVLQREMLELVEEKEKPELKQPPREEVPGEKEAREEEEIERALRQKQESSESKESAAQK
jgi:protein SCO1/2